MAKQLLPAEKPTVSERILVAGIMFFLLGMALIVAGAFLLAPWVVATCAAVLTWRSIRNRGRRKATSGIHGDAHFASEEETTAAGLTGRCDGLILGIVPWLPKHPGGSVIFQIALTRMRNLAKLRSLVARYVGMSTLMARLGTANLVRVPCSDNYAHVALYLPTGTGKTWRVLIPNLLTCDENAVVYDPSGATVLETAEYRRTKFGHDIRVTDPFGVCGDRYGDRCNPLDLMRPGDPGSFDFVNYLSHALVIEKPESRQDPFWHAATVAASTFLLLAIMVRGNETFRNLVSIGELLNATSFRELAESLMDHPDAALRRRAQQMLNFKDKTLASLLSCLSAAHGWLDSPAFGDVLSGSTFSVRSLYERKVTLYVVVPGHRAVESQPFLRALLTAILFAGFEAGADIHRPPVRFYLDEAATLGKLDLLMTLYTQGRKFGMRSMNFFQSVGQVADIVGTPERIQTFRAQMSGELFKAKDYQTAKEVSDWIGSKTVQTESNSWQQGNNGGWSNSIGSHASQGRSGGWSDGSTASVSETGVPLIRPEQVLQLREREAIFMAAGTPPTKLNILGHADIRRCADSEAEVRYQKSYLRRVRWRAFTLLLLAPVCIAAGIGMTVEGVEHWKRRDHPIVQEVEVLPRRFAEQPSRFRSFGQRGWLFHAGY